MGFQEPMDTQEPGDQLVLWGQQDSMDEMGSLELMVLLVIQVDKSYQLHSY